MRLRSKLEAALWVVGTTHNLMRLLSQIRHNREVAKTSQVDLSIPATQITVLIPVLSEAAMIGEAVQHFASLATEVPTLSIVFISTAVERDIPENTQLLGRSAVAQLPPELADRIRWLHYPGDIRKKAAQLNWALSELPFKSSEYVAVFDVDSRPRAVDCQRALQVIAEELRSGRSIDAVQQSAYFRRTYLPGRGESWFARAFAYGQNLWTLRTEFAAFEAFGTPFDSIPIQGPLPLVGHGLYLRVGTLAAVGNFPIETSLEDVPLGVLLAAKRCHVIHMSQLYESDNPMTAFDVLKQKARWFGNYAEAPIALRIARRDLNASNQQITLSALVMAHRALAWVFQSPIYLLALWRSGSKSPRRARWLPRTFLFLGVVVPSAVTAEDTRESKADIRGLGLRMLLLLVYRCANSIGPWGRILLGMRRSQRFAGR